MFKAIHTSNNREIIILNGEWEEPSNLKELRGLGRSNLLVCQECRQPVFVRAGEVRRRNFAHKHEGNCIRPNDSPDLLHARSVLYTWLVEKYGVSNVELEKKIDGVNLPRPIDCYVRGPVGTFAYWLIDKALRPLDRETLQEQFQQLTISIQWIFLTTMLPQLGGDAAHIILTKTERELQTRSRYDVLYEAWRERGRSLHYFDATLACVFTFRGIDLVHAPATFEAHKLVHPLIELQILNKSGEFVHPGEHELWKVYRANKEATTSQSTQIPRYEKHTEVPVEPHKKEPSERMGTCTVCGQQTTDWVAYFGRTNGCICRLCRNAGRA